MNFVFGSFLAAIASLLMIFAGYMVMGFMPGETRANRVALASLLGVAWVVLVASVVGAVMPLRGAVSWIAWVPAFGVFALPVPRRQLVTDIAGLARSPIVLPASAGLGLLWVALLLPFLVFPDLVLFDGKTNHDNFFWCVGAQYLQSHDYLTVAAKNRDFPLFNVTWSFCGWRPAWARMALEGYVALTSASFGQTPIRLYNFLVSALMLPWTLVTFAVARQMGLPPLRRYTAAFVFFCQPILFFFVANGNGPNLLGTLFSGGLWLVALLLADRGARSWPFVITGIFFLHGILASYPEILIFALAPIGLLVLRQIFAGNSGRFRLFGLMLAIVLIGLCLNPVTTDRLWTGIQNSIAQTHNDSGWANIFDRVTFAGYLPSFITLGIPSIRLYGLAGGLVTSVAVAVSVFALFKSAPRRLELFAPMAGFLALLAYTIFTSFGYGWQKSVQFFGIPLAVMFPVLLAGIAQEKLRTAASHRGVLVALLGTLGMMVHTMIGVTAENLKSATSKGLTKSMLTLQARAAAEFPGQPVYVDGATFRAAFFQSMWSARLFPENPLVFISRQDEAGGYLRDFVQLDNPTVTATAGRYYVAANWARAFDYDPVPLVKDRVGVVLKQHNLIPEFAGFYREVGLPEMCKAEFSLAIYPYADGWLEFTLEPNGVAAPQCKLNGTVVTEGGTQRIETSLDASGHLVVRFPLHAGTRNAIAVAISGGPKIDPEVDNPPYPFRILRIASGRAP
jgi:hypothetical protein